MDDDDSCASDEGSISDTKSDASHDSDCSNASGVCLVVAPSKPWGRTVSGLNMTAVSKTPAALDQPALAQQVSCIAISRCRWLGCSA